MAKFERRVDDFLDVGVEFLHAASAAGAVEATRLLAVQIHPLISDEHASMAEYPGAGAFRALKHYQSQFMATLAGCLFEFCLNTTLF